MTTSRTLLWLLGSLFTACDPLASRLEAKRLDFTFAAHTRSFDDEGRLVLTGFNRPFVVRMTAQQQFQDLSQGLPTDQWPVGEIFADTGGNLAAGGWYRAAGADTWVQVTAPPQMTLEAGPQTARVYTFSGAGTVYGVFEDRGPANEQVLRLYRLSSPPSGTWELLASNAGGVNLESATFSARLDGTVFLKDQVWAPGATALVPLLRCPTLRIDQTCEGGLSVHTHPRRNETWLASPPQPGVRAGFLARVPANATFPLDFDALTRLEVTGTRWAGLRVSSDGRFHFASLQKVTLDIPPFEADEGVWFGGLDAMVPEARALHAAGQVRGDRSDLYKASAQLVGGLWVADPVYVWSF